MRAAHSVTGRLAAGLRKDQLTGSQLGVLEVLLHRGPLHQNVIARKLLMSGGNVTMVIDHLERRGLVERLRDETDRRFITVELTGEGRDLIRRVFAKHAKRIAREFSILNSSELTALSRICRKLGKQEQ
ncbi:MAG TPA: MarR family transcriptional regulator [Firmicutes bacterium]|nr:MarR family transcriptional regulator [Bacillota bacterium]